MTKKFKVQVPTTIVRSSSLNSTDFIVITKLIQIYYTNKSEEKSLTLSFDHIQFMNYAYIRDKRTLKKSLNTLYVNGLIMNEVESFPKREYLQIELNPNVIHNKGAFTQLTYNLLNRDVIEAIGHNGIRLLYYYESYINRKTRNDFCYASMETIQLHLNLSRPTIIKTNKLLQEHKFIKKVQHKIDHDWFVNEGGEIYRFDKWNNHYYVLVENINSCEEKIKQKKKKTIQKVGLQ